MEHEAGVEPACFGFKAQRGCRQPTARVLDQAAGIEPAWAAFRAQLGCQQPTPEWLGRATRSCTQLSGFGGRYLAPRITPNWRRADHSTVMPVRAPAVSNRVQHPDCFTLLVGGRQCSRNTCPDGHPLLSRQVQQPWLAYRPNLADAVRVERTHPEGASPGSSRLSTPHARIRDGGRRCAGCTHPCGCDSLSRRSQPPASSPSRTGARPVIQTPFTLLTRQDVISNACRAKLVPLASTCTAITSVKSAVSTA